MEHSVYIHLQSRYQLWQQRHSLDLQKSDWYVNKNRGRSLWSSPYINLSIHEVYDIIHIWQVFVGADTTEMRVFLFYLAKNKLDLVERVNWESCASVLGALCYMTEILQIWLKTPKNKSISLKLDLKFPALMLNSFDDILHELVKIHPFFQKRGHLWLDKYYRQL